MPLPDLKPGEYAYVLTAPDQYDAVTFQLRSAGLEVRDSLSVQIPSGLYVAALVRQPLETTVVAQVVRSGRTHCLDVGGARISLTSDDPNMRPNARNHHKVEQGYVYSGVWNPDAEFCTSDMGYHNSKGRFPANLVMVHGPGCQRVGTRKVKSGTAGPNSHALGTKGIYGTMQEFKPDESTTSYASEDGTEEIADWDCQPNCPVRLLDGQSGITSSAKSKSFHVKYGGDSKTGFMRGWSDPDSQYEDTGGASRFFYQATSLEALESYLKRLTGCS